MSAPPAANRFSALLLEGLDHYRKGKMLEAVRAWEEAYLLEPTNLRAREFLRSALERIHAHMAPPTAQKPQAGHPWLPPPGAPQAKAQPASAARPPTPPGGTAAAPRADTSPWDDGPSLALPQEPASGGDEGAWSIHEKPAPAPTGEDGEVTVWLRGARELVALNDFSGALELLSKVLAHEPDHAEAGKMHALCEDNLTQMYESKLGSMDRVPKVVLPPDEIIWLNLDPRAGFVLAQIDGQVSFEDLYAICGLSQLDTAHILSQLLAEGVVSIQDDLPGPDRAGAR